MRKLNSGTALGFIALFVALSGASYAAIALPKNSVTTKQVKDHSLMKRDFRAGQIPRGANGSDGLDGAVGPQGPAGQAGIANVRTVLGPPAFQCASGGGGCQVASASASCPSGSVVVGGGYVTDVPDDIVAAMSAINATTFSVIATNEFTTSGTVRASAICASGPGVTASASRASELRRVLRDLKAKMG